MRFSANLSVLFKEVPLIERFAAARAAGFDAVEIQFPYEVPAETLAAAREKAGVTFDLLNLPAGDFTTGVRGLAGLPGREAEFRAGLDRARPYVEALGAKKANVLAGIVTDPALRARSLAVLADNLAYVADAFAGADLLILVEAINAHDIPGFLLNTTAEALSIVERIARDNLAVQADLYHMARMGEEHAGALARLGDRLGHVQFADAPGRNEPGTGTLDFVQLFAAVERSGYRGYIAAEYNPSRPTAQTLGWLAQFRKAEPALEVRR